MRIAPIPAGAFVVDTDARLSRARCDALKAAGVAGVVRCIGHTSMFAADNLAKAEIEDILAAGLALVGVYQYYPHGGWSASLGKELGQLAVVEAREAGLPPGCMLALDLEGWFPSKPDAIAYVEAWHAAVAASEYASGITYYLGPGFPLTRAELDALPPAMFWRSASRLVGEPSRGYVMRQSASTRVGGVPVDTDNTVGADATGTSLSWALAGDPEPVPAPAPPPPAPAPKPAPHPTPIPDDPVEDPPPRPSLAFVPVFLLAVAMAVAALFHGCP